MNAIVVERSRLKKMKQASFHGIDKQKIAMLKATKFYQLLFYFIFNYAVYITISSECLEIQ